MKIHRKAFDVLIENNVYSIELKQVGHSTPNWLCHSGICLNVIFHIIHMQNRLTIDALEHSSEQSFYGRPERNKFGLSRQSVSTCPHFVAKCQALNIERKLRIDSFVALNTKDSFQWMFGTLSEDKKCATDRQ